MKKIITTILCIIILINAFAVISFASDFTYNDAYVITSGLFPHKQDLINKLGISDYTFETLVFRCYNALNNHDISIDVSDLNISYNTTVRNALSELLYLYCSDFYTLGAAFGNSFGELHSIYFSYYYDWMTTLTMKAEIEIEAEKILTGLDNNSLSDVTKALLVHDRLINHIEYSAEALANQQIEFDQATIYGALVNGNCVCEGYSRAYAFLMGKLGIPVTLNESDNLSHVWNIIYVEDEPFHVDLTFDDPYYDITGRVRHANFLVSDATIYKNNHQANDYYTLGSSTKFENQYWTKSQSEILLFNDDIYYYNTDAASLIRLSDRRAIFTDSSPYWKINGGYWSGNYTRISCDEHYIYLSLRKEILQIDPDLMTSQVFYIPEITEPDFNIFGFKAEDHMFYIDIYNSPNFQSDTKQNFEQQYEFSVCEHDYEFYYVIDYPTFDSIGHNEYVCSKCGESTTMEVPPLTHWMKGDLNNDGKLNSQDANLISSAILGINSGTQFLDAADCNNDNKVNAADANILFGFILGY